MPLNELKPFSNKVVTAGTHVATLYSIVDLGLQANTFNPDQPPQEKIAFSFELAEERLADGRPMVLTKELTASLGKKSNLRSLMNAMFSKELSNEELSTGSTLFKSMLGKSVLLVVTNKISTKSGQSYAVIQSFAPLPKGTKHHKPENPTVLFDLSKPDNDELAKVPDFIKSKINMQLN